MIVRLVSWLGLFSVRQLEQRFDTGNGVSRIASVVHGAPVCSQTARLLFLVSRSTSWACGGLTHERPFKIRGNGALQKIGAVREGILRKSFLRGGKLIDQALWAIIDEDWYRSKAVWGAKIN